MKKRVLLGLTAAFGVCVVACGGGQPDAEAANAPDKTEKPAVSDEEYWAQQEEATPAAETEAEEDASESGSEDSEEAAESESEGSSEPDAEQDASEDEAE